MRHTLIYAPEDCFKRCAKPHSSSKTITNGPKQSTAAAGPGIPEEMMTKENVPICRQAPKYWRY
jgi:hypothetical protein